MEKDIHIQMRRVAVGTNFHSPELYTPQTLAEKFSWYQNGKENFKAFCRGEFIWCAPNADLIRFEFCPITGVLINWEQVLEEGLEYFKD